MSEQQNEPLVLDMLQWIAGHPRTYGEVMDAWRTSCPRLTIWEDAVDRGLVEKRGRDVCVSDRGMALLAQSKRLPLNAAISSK